MLINMNVIFIKFNKRRATLTDMYDYRVRMFVIVLILFCFVLVQEIWQNFLISILNNFARALL